MKKFTSEQASVDTIASTDVLKAAQHPGHYRTYVGLDVHKKVVSRILLKVV